MKCPIGVGRKPLAGRVADDQIVLYGASSIADTIEWVRVPSGSACERVRRGRVMSPKDVGATLSARGRRGREHGTWSALLRRLL
eukprot:scaffold41444_cov31-Tisochrysis_lutea.AAC.5